MREIVFDTETTGFDPESGDRLVEIGAVELVGHMPTGRQYHQYINPEREVPEEAVQVHGLTYERLRNEPKFAQVAQDFLDFVGDAKLIAHNAAFDFKFLNAELGWLNLPKLDWSQIIDTLAMARKKFPGSPASLDALCRRFGIDNSSRTLHGALLDSEILAEVYLELIGGRQPGLVLARADDMGGGNGEVEEWRPQKRATPLPSRLRPDEAEAHANFVSKLGENALWAKLS
ncbi:MAG: DNA polymerase III subunit epsilon [Silicimonas sp.]|nr:DNA polymerase III subunit epsilon [Silicimonas sp.]